MVLLGVNVDHVATLRQARGGREPDPLMGAALAVLGGADGITVHLREDRRHINDRDLRLMRQLVSVELNLEMAPVKEMVKIALETKPDMATLVPEKRRELTTEGGLDAKGDFKKISDAVRRLKDGGIQVSLFIDPVGVAVEWAAKTGADMVELHTGYYSNARPSARHKELEKVKSSMALAGSAGLMVNAGHGLDYANVAGIAHLPGLRGLYIGHSIVGRAVLVGMKEAVAGMKALINLAAADKK
ncbi:MAG: pyridoxine 5'-phosphate synthase [Nitrospiraceae bacterium]|nr:pyridoxine 5'-phosphate synthase [Nitrospiraceae bacterium]